MGQNTIIGDVIVWLSMNPSILLVGVLIYCFIFALSLYLNGKKPGKNPFSKDCRRRPAELVKDQLKRDAVIKQAFHVKRIPERLDAIVIGSGAGGLTTANLLSRSGWRCLVLEQHDQAGGCCHSYSEKGFEFDVGIHYIGEMEPATPIRFLTDHMTEGQLQWDPLDKEHDIVAIGEPGKQKLFAHLAGTKDWYEHMLKMFPDEKAALDKLTEMRQGVRQSMVGMALMKVKSRWLVNLLIKTGIIHLITKYFTYSRKTLKQVMEEITDNVELRAVLSYCFGDYGSLPSETSFVMQALLLNHFSRGSSYPRGGASEIAMHMIPPIEKAGGKVLVRANVTQILFDDKGKANGVRVGKGSGDIDIYAKTVISAAGVINTYKSLLPKEIAAKSSLNQYLNPKQLRSGHGAMSIFIGLDATAEELNLKRQNVWAFTGNDLDQITLDFFNKPIEDALDTDIPLLFVSFPSAKDATFQERYPGKATCAIVTLAPYRWFEEWKDKRVNKRGEDYESIKNTLAERMWQQVCALYPQIADKREYMSVGTPLSNQHYIAAPRGEIYGLDHNHARFADPQLVMELRPETDIPGLYLSGQDILSCGLTGAMFGGVISAGVLLNRNVYQDMIDLYRECKKKSKDD